MSQLVPLLDHWTAGDGPLYQRLAIAITRLVERGDLAPGTKLPPERALAAELTVSRGTVVAAYAHLAEQGVVTRRQGSGTTIAPVRATSPVGRLEEGPVNPVFRSLLEGASGRDLRDVLDLASASVDCSPVVAEEVANLKGPELHDVLGGLGYAPAGLPMLRERIAQLYTDEGLPTTPDMIQVTTGSQQGISLVTQLLIRPGDAVVTEDPSYAGALDVFRSAGARLFGVRGDDQGLDPADLERVVARVRPALVYLIPTYQNPIGTVLTPARRRAVVDVLERYRVPVLDDTAMARLHHTARPPFAPALATLSDSDTVMTLDGLGKVVWGGLRMGWVRGSAAVVNRLARAKTTTDLGGPLIDQLLATRLLDRLEEATALRQAELAERYRLFTDLLDVHLPDWSYVRPQGGLTLWARLPDGVDGGVLTSLALRHGVRIANGASLSPSESFADHLRLPFVRRPDVLEEAVRRLAAAWRTAGPSTSYRTLAAPPLV